MFDLEFISKNPRTQSPYVIENGGKHGIKEADDALIQIAEYHCDELIRCSVYLYSSTTYSYQCRSPSTVFHYA